MRATIRNGKLKALSSATCRLTDVISVVGNLLLFCLILFTGCTHAPESSRSNVSRDQWLDFQGTWTAAGNRNIMSLGRDRRASISIFEGSLVLAGRVRPNVGFRSKAIVFSDSSTGLVGRAVWTDEHGDEVYSELCGEGTSQRNKISGTIISGTGPYSGITGTYEFSWRFLLEDEDGTVQGQSMGLQGRVRLNSQRAGMTNGVLGL